MVSFEIAGDVAAARDLAEQALSLAPREVAIHHLCGRVAMLEKRLDAAIAHFQTAVAASAGSVKIRCDLAAALRLAGRAHEALDAYRVALRAEPTLPEALLGEAESLADTGDFAGATRALEGLLGAAATGTVAERATALADGLQRPAAA